MDEQLNRPDRSCAVIRDLLPLYAEDMLSAESRAAVEAHLAECPDCAACRRGMECNALALRQVEHEAAAKPLRRFRGSILLNIIGAPIWLPLLVALAATLLAIYAGLWTVVIALFSLPIAFGASALGCLGMTVWAFLQTQISGGLLLLAFALVCAGLTIMSFIGCFWLARLLVRFTAFICRPLARRKKEVRA